MSSKSASALTPLFQPFRRTDCGWVAYHDTEPTTGVAGLAMTWRGMDGVLHYVAALNRERDGQVTAKGNLSEREDLTGAISQALRTAPPMATDADTLTRLLPHPANRHGTQGGPATGPFPEHASLARRAIAEAKLPHAMRAALEACLDHGVPTDISLTALRRTTRAPTWQALALAATNPALAHMVLTCEPDLLAESDPMASIRARWPGLSDAHFRRLRSPDTPSLKSLGLSKTAAKDCLDLMAACPVDWWPRRDAWSAFISCAKTLQAMNSACHGETTLSMLASSSKGDWRALQLRLHRAAGYETVSQGVLFEHGRDCRDPVGALTRAIILPVMARQQDDLSVERLERLLHAGRLPQDDWGDADPVGDAERAAAGLLYAGKSAAAILETSREWHAKQALMEAETRGEDGAASWPALFDGALRFGDLEIVCLADYASLRDEGSEYEDQNGVPGLDHCVASRLTACLRGMTQILSVRRREADSTWSRLSTCEISYERLMTDKISYTVEEHRGRANVEPDPAAIAAVGELTKLLSGGKISVSREALAPRHTVGLAQMCVSREALAPRHTVGLAQMCGYDWRDDAAAANAFRMWQPFLPRWARDIGPDDLFAALVDRGMMPASEAGPSAAFG